MNSSGAAGKPVIALTGATGFIGRHLLRELPKRGYRLRVLLRRPTEVPLKSASAVIGDLARPQNMSAALAGVDAVIHSAGIAHAMSGLPEDDYRLLNTDATVHLAQAAQRAGIRRFVFLSSIRAQCGPVSERVLTEDMEPQPTEAYGRSKLAAEQGLAGLDLDWVALRPVLVYGPGVKGNMAELMRLARTRLLLPFGSLAARRSLLSVDNLVEAVHHVLMAPAPLRRPLIVADPQRIDGAGDAGRDARGTWPSSWSRAAAHASPADGMPPGRQKRSVRAACWGAGGVSSGAYSPWVGSPGGHAGWACRLDE